jgi:hypothetical protein
MIELEYEEAGKITLREATFDAYASWLDTMGRGSASDAAQNLVIDCAVEPNAEGLAALFEDFGFLPETLENEIISAAGKGVPGPYPMVRLKDARAAHTRAAELRSMVAALSGATAPGGAGDTHAAELAALEAELLPLEALDAAERVSRRAVFFRSPMGLLGYRPPPRAAAATYADAVSAFQAGKDASLLGAARTLMLACFIGDPQAHAAQIEQCPALAQWIAGALREVASGGKALTRP